MHTHRIVASKTLKKVLIMVNIKSGQFLSNLVISGQIKSNLVKKPVGDDQCDVQKHIRRIVASKTKY